MGDGTGGWGRRSLASLSHDFLLLALLTEPTITAGCNTTKEPKLELDAFIVAKKSELLIC